MKYICICKKATNKTHWDGAGTQDLSSWITKTQFPSMTHYDGVIMGTMASLITSLTIVYSTVYSGTDQRKHRSSTSLAFVCGEFTGDRWIPRLKRPVARNMFPFEDAIMKKHGCWCPGDARINHVTMVDPCVARTSAAVTLFSWNIPASAPERWTRHRNMQRWPAGSDKSRTILIKIMA